MEKLLRIGEEVAEQRTHNFLSRIRSAIPAVIRWPFSRIRNAKPEEWCRQRAKCGI